ncbi:MAG: hypothetical protein AM1032_000022 [Mycoplasmataceae bacterium]|nr:MAG: hypothetical protein AM1032_000022 [Mycoplasmataceae bacterium]
MNNNEITQIRINGNSINLLVVLSLEIISQYLVFNSEVLDLNDFLNLETLSLTRSKVKKIIIPRNNKINSFGIIDNSELEVLDLKNLNTDIIINIDIINNPKLKFNLNQFSKFINLKALKIINSNCYGSLFSLRNLIKLRTLRTYNIQITPNYEYLTNENLIIHLPINKKSEIDQSNLNNKFLMNINKEFECINNYLKIKDFKESNPQLFENAKIIIENKELLKNLRIAFSFLDKEFFQAKIKSLSKEEFNKIVKTINLFSQAILNENLGFTFWIEERIKFLERENQAYYLNLFE